MANGNLQLRTLGDDLLQLVHLTVAISEGDGEQCPSRLHQSEHTHHLITGKRPSKKSVPGDGKATEALPQQRLCLGKEAVVQIIDHAEDEETV